MIIRRSRVVGTGAYLPDRVVTNDELATRLETSDEWIRQRTGIRRRHIAADGEMTSDLAIRAAQSAFSRCAVQPKDIDVIVLATSTPDNTFPATATRVQAALGIHRGAAFDIQAVCSGFVFALAMADNMLRLGQASTALVIGAEVFSRLLDWEDRSTCVLFGDGAGAVVLHAAQSNGSSQESGILSTHLYSDGAHYRDLYVDGGPGSNGKTGHLRMQGREVFRHAVEHMSQAVRTAAHANGLTPGEIDWLVPHQANIRIIQSIARKLQIGEDRVIVTVPDQANTSAATIPLALDEACRDGRIRDGDLVALSALGGGFAWGSALIRW